jgi:hypothetical protein
MIKSTFVEEDLLKKFGAHVGYLPGEYPQLFNVSQDMWCLLLFLVRPDTSSKINPGKFKYRTSARTQVVIQKVKKAPEPYVLLGPHSERHQFTKFLHDKVPDKDEFALTMEVEVKRMQEMVQAYPKLVCDLQVLVDTKGNFFHLDVDRIFQYGDRIVPSDIDKTKFSKNLWGGLQEAQEYAAVSKNDSLLHNERNFFLRRRRMCHRQRAIHIKLT